MLHFCRGSLFFIRPDNVLYTMFQSLGHHLFLFCGECSEYNIINIINIIMINEVECLCMWDVVTF